MNKSFLKFATDFGPLLIFFTIYYKTGNNLSAAIPPLIISTIIMFSYLLFINYYLLLCKVPFFLYLSYEITLNLNKLKQLTKYAKRV